jgi:DNA-directed RNA polymerase specialized sigma subunit
LRALDERERRLLILWHVIGHPVAHIARMLGISRVHCYRLQNQALQDMLDPIHEPEPHLTHAFA